MSVVQAAQQANLLREQMQKAVFGQEEAVDHVLAGFLAGGHVLLEGVPGLGKTLMVLALSRAFGGEFSRVQFTPDLMPSDVTGHAMYDMSSAKFHIRKGPVFANLLLADEINRAPAKTQAALLEVMQEQQVTIEGESFSLSPPFMTLATQNPVEQEGTYPLPEAQVDRFMLKLKVGYPTKAEELEIMRRSCQPAPVLESVCNAETIMSGQALIRQVWVEDVVQSYIVDLVHATREPQKVGLDIGRYLDFGASPRASIALSAASRAHAFLDGRAFVTPDDVKSVGMAVLRHRVLLTYEAEAEELVVEDLLRRIFEKVKTP
jgi:MoxR-like ATPase